MCLRANVHSCLPWAIEDTRGTQLFRQLEVNHWSWLTQVQIEGRMRKIRGASLPFFPSELWDWSFTMSEREPKLANREVPLSHPF